MKTKSKIIDTPHPKTSIMTDCHISVQRQFKDACNINNIVRRFASGDLTALGRSRPFGNLLQVPENLQDALAIKDNIQTAFASLPLEVQAKYQTPEALLHALSDPSQMSTLQTLGVFQKPEEKTINNEPPKETTKSVTE